MTTPQAPASQGAGPVPVACALGSAGLAAQGRRWRRLMARAMAERAETADGLRIAFRDEPGVQQELRELAAVESGCCPWATWRAGTDAGMIILDVRSAGQGIAALHGMFALGRRPGEESAWTT